MFTHVLACRMANVPCVINFGKAHIYKGIQTNTCNSLSLQINIYTCIRKHFIKHTQRHSQMYYMCVQIYQHSQNYLNVKM